MFSLITNLFPLFIFVYSSSSSPSLQLVHERLPVFEKNEFAILSRLPTSVIPNHYDLFIIPIIQDRNDGQYLKAPGKVLINVTCIEATRFVTLHSADVLINPNNITVNPGNLQVIGFTENRIDETVTIELENLLEAGEYYSIEIIFEARVSNDGRFKGLYLSEHVDEVTGEITKHAATQFQAQDARRAFPCFDEPALKATFQINVGRPATFQTLSNMNRISISDEIEGHPGYYYDVYNVTPARMSTYLVAFIVSSNFVSKTADSNLYPPAIVSVWGPKPLMENTDEGKYAAETVAKTLAFFDNYTGIEYSFPKMDSVAISQFAYGAMENWGLNIYSPSALLYSPTESTQSDIWRVANVIAHEISHQWFGNLVTMDWWSDLWLNEGLANYMEFLGGQAVHPEFEPWQRFGIDSSQPGMTSDGLPSAIPVHIQNETHYVQTPSGGTYQKGSALIKMLEGFLSKRTLQGGLQSYLRELANNVAHQDDLFEHLTKQAKEDGTLPNGYSVKEIMDSWTLQPGFPLIRVFNVGNNKIYISQERFANDRSYRLEPHTWYVPISYVTEGNSEINEEALIPKTWIHPDEVLILHSIENSEEWILLNPEATNFYRVLYDEHFTRLLRQQLESNHTMLTPLSRGQLLDDYFHSAYGQYISLEPALELTAYLHNEMEHSVWIPAFKNLRKILEITSDDNDIGEKFRSYLSTKAGPPFESSSVYL